jgi:hypothetical protein
MILNLLGIEKDMEHEHRPPIIERTLVTFGYTIAAVTVRLMKANVQITLLNIL